MKEGESQEDTWSEIVLADRTASAKAPRQKWVCPASLRDSKETSVTSGLSEGDHSRRQNQRGMRALQAVLRPVAFTPVERGNITEVLLQQWFLTAGQEWILHIGDIWQYLVVMNWEGILLASSG